MAVTWQWSDKLGTMTIEQETASFDFNIYGGGNCLGVVLYEWEEDGEMWHNLNSFWSDEKHLKRCLGLDKDWDSDNMYILPYEKLTKLRLNTKYKESRKIAALFMKAFDEITIEFYKEDNNDKA